jgi:hypothetical protein
MRAVLINPVNQTVTEIDVTSPLDSAAGMYAHMKAADPGFVSNMVECVSLGPNVDLFLDEEGALEAGRAVWRLQGSDQGFAGPGILICSDEEGETIALHRAISLAGAIQVVQWTNLETTGDFGEGREYETDHPIFGKTTVLEGGKPIYRERS